MSESKAAVTHISSAVVLAQPDREADVIAAIRRIPDTEIFHNEGGKIVVVLEGPTSKQVGGRLAEISLIDGVISASLVYEQVETIDSLGESS